MTILKHEEHPGTGAFILIRESAVQSLHMDTSGIILLGLGPGDPNLLTRQAWDLLQRSQEIFVRTRKHPSVQGFPPGLVVNSFDSYFEESYQFDEASERIVQEILRLGRRPQGVIYAVPGHPLVAETTTREIQSRARLENISVQVIEGLSFLEPVFSALQIDPLPRLSLVDAIDLARLHVPNFPPDVPALVAQISSKALASEVKTTLMAVYPDDHPVTLVHAAGSTDEHVDKIPLNAMDQSQQIDHLTALFIPPLAEATSMEGFQETIAHLRAPDGCPWDREQTHLSLRPYLLEEAYEVLAALDAGDADALREELGDLLLQIVLHAQIANEEGEFRLAEVIQGIQSKLIRRHPHVFGDVAVDGVGTVLQNWEKLKAAERTKKGKSRSSIFDGIPIALPALSQAEQLQSRAARVGFEWPELQQVYDKVHEELNEVRQAQTVEERTWEIGDILFALVNLARTLQVEPESALREASMRFRSRFHYIEQKAHAAGKISSDLSIAEMLALWEEAKGRSE